MKSANQTLDLFNKVIEAIAEYELGSNCVERNEGGGGKLYKNRVVFQVHEKMFNSCKDDLMRLDVNVDMDNISYYGGLFSFSIKEE